ncbi:MAG: hypothetical protein KAG61_14040 [Bacteriovoracaceae bacterium]|nr:hypothetical protein [Bacteriovoracaceae bacterium]
MTSKKNKKLHKEIRKKYTSGPICTVEEGELYPEHLRKFAEMELRLKIREE